MAARVIATSVFALVLTACANASEPNAISTTSLTASTSSQAITATATGQTQTPTPTQTPTATNSSARTPMQSQNQSRIHSPTQMPAPTQKSPTASGMRTPTAHATTRPPTASPTRTTTRPPLTTAPAITWPPTSLSGKDFTAIPTTKKVIALTFDAGGNNAGVAKILSTLRAKNVTGTFFFTGKWVKVYPTNAKTIAGSYLVGNHTQTHPYLTKLTDTQVRSEINTLEQTMRTIIGKGPAQIFRFPFGATNTHLINLVNDEGYVPIRWTVDTLGWKGTSGAQSTTTVKNRVINAAKPGAIILMHVGSHPTDKSTLDADALASIIDTLRAKGYTFVNLNAFLP